MLKQIGIKMTDNCGKQERVRISQPQSDTLSTQTSKGLFFMSIRDLTDALLELSRPIEQVPTGD